jgi:primosomal protein N' (replication factor Y) (superfamily II helicase)
LIQIKSEHQRLAEFTAETLHRRFGEKIDSSVTLHPVVPAQIERVKGFYRFQILLRTRAILRLSRTIREVMDSLSFPDEVQVSVDVDPYQLL